MIVEEPSTAIAKFSFLKIFFAQFCTCFDVTFLMELKKMKDTLVEKDELEKAKTQLLSSESFGLESNLSLLYKCFETYIVSGKALSFKESTDAIKKVTSKQVQNCAKKIFKKENFAIAVLGSSTITKK